MRPDGRVRVMKGLQENLRRPNYIYVQRVAEGEDLAQVEISSQHHNAIEILQALAAAGLMYSPGDSADEGPKFNPDPNVMQDGNRTRIILEDHTAKPNEEF